MKITKHIPGKFIQAVFGVLLALFVLTQAAIVPDQVAPDEQEQSDAKEGNAQQITKAAAVPSSSFQINLDYQSYLLNEVFFQDEENDKTPIAELLVPNAQKALKILFRRIISPNAP